MRRGCVRGWASYCRRRAEPPDVLLRRTGRSCAAPLLPVRGRIAVLARGLLRVFESATTSSSTLLCRGPHDACNGFGHLFPLRFLDHELLSALVCQSVILELPIAVRSCLPSGGDPPSTFKPMQSGIERAVLHLREVVRGPLNVFAYLMTVRRTIPKRPENKQVHCALENARSRLCPFCDRRHSTLERRNGRLSTTDPSRTASQNRNQDGPVDEFRA